MNRSLYLSARIVRWVALAACLAISPTALAQQTPPDVAALRQQYDALMLNFERIAAVTGDSDKQLLAERGRQAMRALTDQQLFEFFSRTRVPNLSTTVAASGYAASRWESQAFAAAAKSAMAPMSSGFPDPIDLPAGCTGVTWDAETRFALLMIKELADTALAAMEFVCAEDIAGFNTSLVCVPFAVAADAATWVYETADFCSGEETANQTDANFKRLGHIHTDLDDGISALSAAITSATTTIVSNDNANTSTIVTNDNTNTATIVANDNTNATAIIANDNANLATILADAAANKKALEDLILRTQIEADLAMDGNPIGLYELPASQGGYLDLVQTIVTETLAKVLAAGGTIGDAQTHLDRANAFKAAGNFKSAYYEYTKAYRYAVKP